MTDQKHRSSYLLLAAAALVLIALALFLFPSPPASLAVRVVDASTGQPLPGALVSARTSGEKPLPTAVAGEAGIARFEGLPPAEYELRVQKPDYVLGSDLQATIQEEQQAELTVRLEPRAGERLFVGLDSALVVEIDRASLLTLRIIELPSVRAAPVRLLRLNPVADRLYAVAGGRGHILESTTSRAMGEMMVNGPIEGLEVSSDGRYLLAVGVANGGVSSTTGLARVWVLDATNGQLLSDTLPADAGVLAGIAWQPDGVDSTILESVSPEARRWNPRLPGLPQGAGAYPTGASLPSRKVVVSPDHQFLYTWFQGYAPDKGLVDVLAMVASDTGEWVDEQTPTGVAALAVSPQGDELYVLNERLGTLAIVDLVGTQPRTVVPAGKQPGSLTISPDGTRAYVGDRGAAALLVVDLTDASLVHTISLPGEPLSLAVR